MTDPIPDEARKLLGDDRLMAHLATSHDDRPHVAPVWYALHGDAIEVTTTGRKLANLKRNPRVAMSVQKDVDGDPQWGVTIQGSAAVIEDDDAAEETLHRINRRYDTHENAWSENTPVRISVGNFEHWEY